MKYVLVSIFLSHFLLLSCTGTAQQGKTQMKGDTKIVNLTAKQAKNLIDKGTVKVIDVRTPGEYAQGHLPGAININFNSPDFEQVLSKLDKNQEYLVHCRSGHRSGLSMKSFKKLGFKKIDHMNHGIIDWNRSGLPLEK